MVLHLSLWKGYRERILILFGLSVHLAIATCAICFTGKISGVHTSVVK